MQSNENRIRKKVKKHSTGVSLRIYIPAVAAVNCTLTVLTRF